MNAQDAQKKILNSEILKKINFGIINIDKPAGPTSFTITDFVRKSLGINKATHLGTLDPAVTGVLPIALGKAARLSGYLMHADKEYTGKMHIHEDINLEKIQKTIKKKFLGKIKQLPPLRSRVKREERERKVYEFEILEKKGKDIRFRIRCQAGTYIRKLIHDLGQELKIGAHMIELCRTRAGLFDDKSLISIDQFKKAVEEFKKGNSKTLDKIIIEPEEVIKKTMPTATLKKEFLDKIRTGSPIFKKFIKKIDKPFEKGQNIAFFIEKKLVEIAKAEIESKDFSKLAENEIIARPKTVLVQ